MRTEKGGISSTSSSSGAHRHHHHQQQHNPCFVDSAIDSPPRHAIWSTERRLAMKPPPGAPGKAPSSRGRPYLPNYSPCRRLYPQQHSCSSFGDNDCRGAGGGQRTTSRSRDNSNSLNSMTLILPSKTIDEDDDDQCMAVSLPFRPTRLSFTYSCDKVDERIMNDTATEDPTTVLLGPTTTATTPGGVLSWHDDDIDHESVHTMDQDDDDMSPRLFHRFGERTLWRYESIEIAEDESDAIFRSATVMGDDSNSGDFDVDNNNDHDDFDDSHHGPEPPIQERFTASPMLRGKDDARI